MVTTRRRLTRSAYGSPEPLLSCVRRRRKSNKAVVLEQQPQVGSSEESPLQISCVSETKPNVDPLLRLRPTPAKPKREPSQQSTQLVLEAKRFLVSEMTSTSDLNTMVDLANHTFFTLDLCRTDYRSFHRDVYDFIRSCCNVLEVQGERAGCGYAQIIHRHKQVVNVLNSAEQSLSNAQQKLDKANVDLQPKRIQLNNVRELMVELEATVAEGELKIEHLSEERDRCYESYLNVEREARETELPSKEAEAALKEIDQRVADAFQGKERRKDLLMSHIGDN
ncbi:hypothetical protein LguiB_034677 [Lonicera macranthoides]